MSKAEVIVHAVKFQKLYLIDLKNDLLEEYVLLKQFLTSQENKMILR